MKRENNTGQVLLLVLLAMAGLATMVLSVISRSVSEVSVTTREEESLRAFSAAEAGVEEALVTGTIGTEQTGTLEVPAQSSDSTVSTYTANIESYPEDPTKFNYPFELSSGEAASVWFMTRDGDNILSCSDATCFNGTLTLCWGKPGAGGIDPAIFVNVIYDTGSGYAISPIGFDANDSRRTGGSNPNRFSDSNADCMSSPNTIAGQSYMHRATLDLGSSGLASGLPAGSRPVLMRVTMLYNDNEHTFGISTGSPLPSQGRKVTSEGQAGEVTRTIDAYLLNPEMPFIFDAALYSGGGIVK